MGLQKSFTSKSLSLFLTLFLVAGIFSINALPAHSQVSLQIGGNEGDFKAHLASEGFDRITTKKIGLSNSIFEACREGKRYSIKFVWTGEIKRRVIGNCRQTVDRESIIQMLRDQGYRRISMEDRSGKYIAIACHDNGRFRIQINYMGDIRGEKRIGRCEQELSPSDITAKLEQEGYDRIRFTDRKLPKYVVEACLERKHFELILDRFGEIRDSRRIGKCRTGIEVSDLKRILKDRGLTRIKIIDKELPRYMAEACRGNDRVQVVINRWGDVRDEVRVGNCRNAFSVEQIIQAMEDNGYSNISVKRDGNNFITKGCRDNQYSKITLSKFGELIDRKELGSCKAPRINELADKFRDRGFTGLSFYAEGCRKGKRVRIEFDEFANRVGRDVLGSC